MRANRKFLHARKNDRAEVGIGTLIVFIAMVLVAAVAAAVLINTSGALQSKASKTGTAATQQVSNTLLVLGKYGRIDTGTSAIDRVYYEVGLAPGASGVDISELKLRWSDGTNAPGILGYNTGAPGTSVAFTSYGANWKRGSGAILDAGEMVEIDVLLDDGTTPREISTDKSVSCTLFPEGGNPTDCSFHTPTTYGSATYIDLQ